MFDGEFDGESKPVPSDRLTILHTNDYHNRLTEAQAQRLRRLFESVAPSALLLDAGDAVSSGNITFLPGGEPILDTMSDIGYSAMTTGNREFHFSRIGFFAKVSRAKFPILCANVRTTRQSTTDPNSPNTGADSALPVRPYVVLEAVPGWRVAILGIMVPMITERMLARKVSSFVFDDPISVAADVVPQLRKQYAPDLLIALTHIGYKQDRLLAETVSGIDLIVGGHTHVVLEHGERFGETLVVQAGSHGRFVGRVDIDRTTKGLSMEASLAPL